MPINLGSAIGYLDLDTSKFTRGFQTALSSLRTFQSESATISDKISAAGTAMTSAGSTLTRSVTVPLVGLGTAAVATTTKFESAMSQVQATMGITKDAMAELDGTSVNAMDALGDLAQQLGATTKYSAVEAAEAINYMALAGYDVQKTYGMLPTVLDLAAAGNFDLARASDMVTDSQTALGLSIEETATMVDEWARAASRSNTSVEQLGEAILTIGGTAQYMAGGTDRLATVLGVLADNGIKGSEAGTHLRNMILKLASPTDKGAIALDKLGVSVFDAAGNMRDFQDIFQDFSVAMQDLTDEQRIQYFSELFNTRDVAAANALLTTSADRWNELGDAIANADGAAKQMSETQLDNLSGQLTILKSSLEGLAISFGELLLPLVKSLTAGIQSVVSWLNSLDENQKKTFVRVLEVVALVGPALLILGKLATAVASIIRVVGLLKTALSAAAAGPIGLIIAAIAALVGAFIYLWNNCEGFRQFWINLWEGIKSVVSSVVDSIVNFFTQTIPQALEVLSQWFTELPYKLGYALGAALGSIVQWAVDSYNAVVEGFPKVVDAVVQFFAELPGKVWVWLVQTIENIKTWVSDAWQTIQERFPALIESILDFFRGLPDQMLSIGIELINGLWEGIQSTAGWLWNQISGFASGVIDGFKAFFGIASPSKVMAEQGEYLVQGLGEGIENEEGSLLSIVDQISDQVIERMTELFSGLSLDLEDAVDPEALAEYNDVLSVTVSLFAMMRDHLAACTEYTQQLLQFGVLLTQTVSPAVTDMDSSIFLNKHEPTESQGKEEALSKKDDNSNKPDILTINLQMEEETIETVVVDLLKREVRS